MPTFRLRARSQLTELRSNDLRFTPDEAASFLNTIMGLDLCTEDAKALEARTEGWIVGLQLAALSLQGRASVHEFISAFTGSHCYVLEYLTEEVVRCQPEPVQQFLIQTSILDRLGGPLCDAVYRPDVSSEERDGEAMLTHLLRSNLFIIPLDEEHRWYRYHNLFADLLGNLLRKECSSEGICELHRRASKWHEENGSLDDAIKHAMQAQDFERAALLIERAVSTAIAHGRLKAILDWIEALPEPSLRARPRLGLYQGWVHHLSGRGAVAEQILRNARETLQTLPPSPESVALRGELAALLAGIATVREETSKVRWEAEEALTYLPEHDLISRARVYVALGTAYAYDDEMEQATKTWHQARDLALKAGNLFLAAGAIEMLAGVQIYHQGRLREGARTLQQMLDLATTEDGSPLPFTGTAHALSAEIYLERNELDAAAGYLEKGIELLQQSGIGYGLIHTFCAKARLARALGDRESAQKALKTAERASEAHPMRHLKLHLERCQVRLRLWLGDVEGASLWARGDRETVNRQTTESLPAYLRDVEQISLARVHLARGEADKVLATLDRWQAHAEAAGRMAQVIEISLLKALAWHAQGDIVAALRSLERSLSLAEPEGYVRLFLDEGEPVVALLHQAAARGIGSEYTSRLLEAFGESSQDRKQTARAQDSCIAHGPSTWGEPLTKREMEVLRLICEGLSNQQISERLVVTLNTVKKHNSNIYGKLGVTSRVQAIVRARELGLC